MRGGGETNKLGQNITLNQPKKKKEQEFVGFDQLVRI